MTSPTPTPLSGYVELPRTDAPGNLPGSSALPAVYSPKVAGYAGGPFLIPALITPSGWRWRRTRTYLITDERDGLTYRAVRVIDRNKEFVGYWAVELMGTPLFPTDWVY
jgi:hypothetical protein